MEKLRSSTVEDVSSLDGLAIEEKIYVRRKFEEVMASIPREETLEKFPNLSSKVKTLIAFLTAEQSPTFSGLVFVRTRAEVAVLSRLLTVHAPFFEISTFVGASGISGRKGDIGELIDLKNQRNTLDDLRQGRKNLIVTTNALEEGIDVSRCSVVVCFDRPPNLKSFVQRRGRARKSDSKYVIMFDHRHDSDILDMWNELENEMKRLYMDELRHLQELERTENLEEADPGIQVLSVSETGYVFNCFAVCQKRLCAQRLFASCT